MKQKEKAVNGLTSGIEFLLKKNKVDYVKGHGKFASPTEIEIDLIAGGTEKIQAKNIIIATGSEPTVIPGIPVDEKYIITSNGALSLEKIPKKMVIVDRICPSIDIEISTAFKKSLDKQGFKFIMKAKVMGARANEKGG
jgi:dihydrolipoamide dehydrogenase